MLEVYGFGKLRLANQQMVVNHFPTRQVEELLGFLLLQPRIRHPREKLITLLWPDIPSASNGRHRFSIVLSRLRQLFSNLQTPFEQHIFTTRDWIELIPNQPFFFDREQFILACKLGFNEEQTQAKEQHLQTAVSLYRADFMEGIYADWCLTEREYLARLRLRALGQLMHSCMQRHAFAEAIEYGATILQEDPLREETHRALMHCYQQQNRPDLAAHQYFACQALLESELQTQPLPETTQLFTEIMVQRAQSSLTSESVSPAQQENIQKAYNNFLAAARQLAQSF